MNVYNIHIILNDVYLTQRKRNIKRKYSQFKLKEN